MKKLRIYLDTSVVGGCCDEEFSAASQRGFNAVNLREGYGVIAIYSPLEVV